MNEANGSSAQSGIDTSVPHSARIWNYWLGGKDNYEVDRVAGDEYSAVYPGIVDAARASRACLGRVVRYLTTEEGVRQFLDIGTGLPTADNTHQIAQRYAAECRIVYVDNDPLVLAHARALLTSTEEGATSYVHADMHDPAAVLAKAAETLDFTKPIGLLLYGVLGHVRDQQDARSLVRELTNALPEGSFLALFDGTSADPARKAADLKYATTGAAPYFSRSPQEVVELFTGLDVLEPGLVPRAQWRPDHADIHPEFTAEVASMGGVARVGGARRA